MERSVDVATGESVAFSYELAGLGSRFLALLVDLSIQIGVVILVALLLVWVAQAAPGGGKDLAPTSKIADAIVDSIFIIAAFMLFFGYFIIFEWRFNGRTPGKRLLGIRVVRDGGFPVDFTASVVRNVVRVLEFALGFYAVSAIATLLSPMNRRLGDLAAGTIVVRDNRYERTAPRSFGRDVENARDDVLVRDLTPSQRDLILRYAERRTNLSLAARTAVAAQIAASVRPKLAVSFEHIDDDHLLVHLATTALS
jgi:uncharacterized RDD family membrane protein YckC